MTNVRQNSLDLFTRDMEIFSEIGHVHVDAFSPTLPSLAYPSPTQDWAFNRVDALSQMNGCDGAGRNDGGHSKVSDSRGPCLETVKSVGWKQQPSNSLDGAAKKIKTTRWKKEKSRMGCLEQQQQEKQALADEALRENKKLKLRAKAMEHILAARERQLSILKQYHRLCGPGSTDPNSHEAKEYREAATATLPHLGAKFRKFVDDASLKFLQISNNEKRGDTSANKTIQESMTAKLLDLCSATGQAFTLNPCMQFEMSTYRVDLHASGAPPDRAHWEKVVMELHMEQEQLEEVAICWDMDVKAMAQSHDELLTVQTELAQTTSGLRLHQLQQTLTAAMHHEGIAYRTLCFTLYGQILAPVQLAKVFVHSFPYFPHARELMSCMVGLRMPVIAHAGAVSKG
ncbi:hypothetical protein CEUSTIGMA_g13248.t1 [Chlamydomonas eustigma]|uniref:Uncharacterized protein n=1 Tax=Chlamydomonas eustigma TaxID=1157962 RepID=A0A250XS37_9CHLO|nr:hypothetical protein CEUSTIGMA_g13248.t1 [Chlamydomonas eustigma]|eukprot:GAX85833.1 hypothetical protein CEUSTIGMA_g13248.t1 [Chlamydomonas eustigma]